MLMMLFLLIILYSFFMIKEDRIEFKKNKQNYDRYKSCYERGTHCYLCRKNCIIKDYLKETEQEKED